MKKIIAFSIGFCVSSFIWGIYWMVEAFEYQDELIDKNQYIYELEQTIEMYQLWSGELK